MATKNTKSQSQKFNNRFLWPLAKQPVMIVGQNPGRQRIKDQTFNVWEGNRSSDFLSDILIGFKNVILTNVCLYQDNVEHNHLACQAELQSLISTFKPRKVLALGDIAHEALARNYYVPVPIIKFQHPSYILRFNKDQLDYEIRIRQEVLSA